MATRRAPQRWLLLGIALGAALFGALLFGRLSHPLIWQDEAQTAALAGSVLVNGYPKVHGGRNVAYDLALPMEVGVRQDLDAFVVSPWVQFYFGALGVALAERAGEPYDKTARLRLPFAIAGALGALLPLTALWALAGPGLARRLGLTLAYLAGLCVSISLILHLREARYYPLAVLGVSASCCVIARGRMRNRARVRDDLLLGALLVLLLHTLVPAFFALSAAIAVDAALDAVLARGAPTRGRLASFARALLPVAGAALVAVPSLCFYEFLAVREALIPPIGRLAPSSRIAYLAFYLLRYEWLGVALVCAALRLAIGRGAPRDPAFARFARFLWLVVAAYGVVLAGIPWFFSRYAIAISPLLLCLAILESALLADTLGRTSPGIRAVGTGVGWGAIAISIAVRSPEIAGRLYELAVPERGPLDFAIAHLRERYPDPSRLLVASNYECLVYDFYLGSRVLDTGLLHDDAIPAEQPDVVIRRHSWVRNRSVLDELLLRDTYERVALPVRDLPTNGIPELLRPPRPPATYHRFAEPPPDREKDRLIVYHRMRR